MLMHRGKPESRRGLFQSWTRPSTGEPEEPPRRGRRAFESCSRPGSLSPSEGPGQFWGRGTAREVLGVLSALECFPGPPFPPHRRIGVSRRRGASSPAAEALVAFDGDGKAWPAAQRPERLATRRPPVPTGCQNPL
jgi:hypothetical protein